MAILQAILEGLAALLWDECHLRMRREHPACLEAASSCTGLLGILPLSLLCWDMLQ